MTGRVSRGSIHNSPAKSKTTGRSTSACCVVEQFRHVWHENHVQPIKKMLLKRQQCGETCLHLGASFWLVPVAPKKTTSKHTNILFVHTLLSAHCRGLPQRQSTNFQQRPKTCVCGYGRNVRCSFAAVIGITSLYARDATCLLSIQIVIFVNLPLSPLRWRISLHCLGDMTRCGLWSPYKMLLKDSETVHEQTKKRSPSME